jgi:4-amino-4-deoxy-L-arabinose transferase-like glycosyltransferase
MSSRIDPAESSFHRTAWMLLGTLAAALFVPPLAMRGMSWDGVLYATISRNMAAGECDGWHPLVTATFMRHFREHPPLAFWLEAVFFRTFGDHFWVERLYSICTGLVTGTILLAVWRHLLRDATRARAHSWLPALLWLSCSFWSYRHNILENTLGLFAALSIYASLRALASERAWVGWSALAGTAITAALLAKGPVGLFPAITPALAWLTHRRGSVPDASAARLRRAACVQAAVLCGCALSLSLLLLSTAARDYLGEYWHQQVLASVRGERDSGHGLWSHLKIVGFLAKNLQFSVLLTAIAMLAARLVAPRQATERESTERESTDPEQGCGGAAWFFLLTALSASLPLVACPKQHGHYTAPSLPFYALALALWCLRDVQVVVARLAWLAETRPQTWLRRGIGVAIVLILAISVGQYGRPYRDREIMRVSNQVAHAAGARAIVAVMPRSWDRLADHEQLRLHAYLYRDHSISLWCVQPESVPAHLRLTPPDAAMSVSYEQIVTDSGLECYPLVRGGAGIADRPSQLR